MEWIIVRFIIKIYSQKLIVLTAKRSSALSYVWLLWITVSLHRAPLIYISVYLGAEKSPLWELDRLCEHYHPTVALFARNLRKGLHC